MVIKNNYYEFYRNTSGYYVRAVRTSDIISVTLNKVINGSNVQVTIYSVDNTATQLVLSEEAIYNITITYDVSGTENVVTHGIRYFPTLKDSIISNMRDTICGCDETQLPCGQSVLHPTIQKVYNAQLMLNSVLIYRHLMFPLEFMRVMDCCITQIFGQFSEILINGLSNQYASINIRGVPCSDEGTYKRVLALMYIVLYYSEIALSEYTDVTAGDIPANDELAIITAQFDDGAIEDCYTLLGMDFDSLYSTFQSCYTNKSLIVCNEIIIVEASVSHLRYNGYTSIMEIATTLNITTFTWDVVGLPQNLKLNDTEGVLIDEAVFGDTHTGGFQYPITTPQTVTWTLSGDNVDSIDLTTRWVYAHYYGKNETGIVPDAAEILAGTKVVSDIRSEVTIDQATTNREYGWIAVSNDITDYNRWKVLDPSAPYNEGNIAVGNFIYQHAASIIVNGVAYEIYMYSYASEINHPLKLFRI